MPADEVKGSALEAANRLLADIRANTKRAAKKPEPPPTEPVPSISLTYERVTLHLDGFDLHVDRLDDDHYRLYAKLNYITIAPVEWMYDEEVYGTPDQVYEHAINRITELVQLKVVHDAVHDRVRRMSEGENGGAVSPVIPLRDGTTTRDPRLDRLPQWDERNRQFPIRALLEEKAYKPRSYTWSVDQHLDQGNEGACVGFAWAHELIARPKVVDEIDTGLARWIYKTAQRYDPWSGENYEGTSLLAGAKVIRGQPPTVPEGRGLIEEYRWIFDVDEMVRTIGYFGPVVLGVWWWSGMMDTDAKGFIHPTGSRLGGHAILAKAVNVKAKTFTLHNSWGEDWGDGGDCKVSFEDMATLLGDDGEACVPLGRKALE